MSAAARQGLRLSLPATSANLGPAFDAAGLALSLTLRVDASIAPEFAIAATGRDAPLCAALEDNLILNTYREVLRAAGRTVLPLALSLHNEIPLGMGCGSSAAALLAGVTLAVHFGELDWTDERIVTEASRREGHPDNVAACWYGGFTVSTQEGDERVAAATFFGDPTWRMLLAVQPTALLTKGARALLPETYSRADAVRNVQRTALLVAAFAQSRLDLLLAATKDRLHQPYRMQACPLLPVLLPLAGEPGIAAVTLSGAGPSVLLFVDGDSEAVRRRVLERLPAGGELLELRIASGTQRIVLD